MEDTQAKIQKLQMIEEKLNTYTSQKQQLMSTVMEFENAEKSLETSEDSYQIIGNIMVKKSKEELQKEVKEKLDDFKLKLASLEKQEAKLRSEAEEIQNEISKNMNPSTKE